MPISSPLKGKNKMKNKMKNKKHNLVMRVVADPIHIFDKAREFSQMLGHTSKRHSLLSKAMLDIYNKKMSIACVEGEGRIHGDDNDWELRKIGQYNWGMFSQKDMFVIDDKEMVEFLDKVGLFKAKNWKKVVGAC